jgi:Tol biopolymer transport system component
MVDVSKLRLLALAAMLSLVPALLLAGNAVALSQPPVEKAEIFFTNGGRILSMKADGTDRKVLTRPNGSVSIFSDVSDSAPLASPNGQTVLFSRSIEDAPRRSGILAVDRDGGATRKVLGFRSEDEMLTAVDWNADGTRFYALRLWAVERSDEITVIKSALISAKPNGGSVKRLHHSSTFFRTDEFPSGPGKWIPIDASVTPNGKTALLAMISFSPGSKMRLARVNLSTGKRTWLLKDAGPADISPNGRTVVFASERARKNKSCYDGYCVYQRKLYLMNLDGSNLRPLLPVNREGNFISPDFSRDGSRVVFQTDSDTNRSWFGPEIWSVKTDGSCLTRLTNGSPLSGEPSWGAGSVTGPAICGNADLRPFVDVDYPKRAEKLKPRPMWLGQEYDNLLLSEAWIGYRSMTSRFADCGALDTKDCKGRVSVRSAGICAAGVGNELTNGTYSEMERVRGGIVLTFDRRGPSGAGTGSHLVTGGIDVEIQAEVIEGVRPVSATWRREAIDHLRYVGSNSPPARFHPPVFAYRTIRTARSLLRNYEKLGSLKQAAIKTGIFGRRGSGRFQVTFAYERKGAQAWLRFARDLEGIGSFKTVECRGR